MGDHNTSRWIGPLALGAAVLAVLFVIAGSVGGDDSEPTSSSATTEERQESSTTATGTSGETSTSTSTSTTETSSTAPEQETYRVRPGDTLALIAERTGVSVEELQELNPDVDPEALTVGQRIKLTE